MERCGRSSGSHSAGFDTVQFRRIWIGLDLQPLRSGGNICDTYAAVSTCHVSQSQYTLSHTRGRTQNDRIQPLADPGGGGAFRAAPPQRPSVLFPPPPPKKKRSISVNFLARARSGSEPPSHGRGWAVGADSRPPPRCLTIVNNWKILPFLRLCSPQF